MAHDPEDSTTGSEQISALLRWDFDSTAATSFDDQLGHLLAMFDHLQTRSLLGVSAQELGSFISSVHDGYSLGGDGLHFSRHYHNFHHAFDVTQTLFAIFGFAGSQQLLNPLEKVVLLLAAVGHDIAHPGVSNQFIVSTNHPLVLTYGYASVLENMHAAKTMALVERHDLLRNLAANQKMRAQQLLVCSILATDVVQHDRLLQDVQCIISERSQPLSSQCGVHNRLRVGSFLLHCADVSNAAKPFHIASHWTELIMTEFFDQGEAEKRFGLPVSPNCDAQSTRMPELQMQFIAYAILPTFSLLERLLPDAHIALQYANDNIFMRHFVWLCAAIGSTLIDCVSLDLFDTLAPKSRASVVVPACFLLVAALRTLLDDAKL